MAFNPKDHYYRKAKQENYAARSIYKLEEIDQKLKVLKPGQLVMDLGASPGSWSQYASKKIGDKGRLIGVDLKPVQLPNNTKLENCEFIVGNALDIDWESVLQERSLPGQFDIILSDMAPSTTGIRITDQARSMELCEFALDFADKWLKPKGHFICKLFHSDEFQTLKKRIQSTYQKFDAIKPHSTRAQSKEIFLVGLNKKN